MDSHMTHVTQYGMSYDTIVNHITLHMRFKDIIL